MKPHSILETPRAVTFALAIFVFALFFYVFAVIACAQDAAPLPNVGPVPSPGVPASLVDSSAPAQVSGGLEHTIIQLAQTHPWILSLLALIGALRFVIKPLMTAARFFAAQTSTTKDEEFIDKVERSYLYTLFLFAVDWLTSIKVPAKSKSTALNTATKLLLCFSLSAFALSALPGCSLLAPKGNVTWEATQFLTYRDVWTTTLALYDHAKDQQVAGKVSTRDAADIDAAWNLFRVGYKQALALAQNDVNARTPESVRKLANDVLTLIYAASN
jgi:hypothetical protein